MQRNASQMLEERARIMEAIRSFFSSRGYLEVETPLLVESPGMEPELDPFEAELAEPDGARRPMALVTSPEYAMKKLLGEGMERIFTLGKAFRNREELGGSHNPEFTMLEWYRQGADYLDCMDETEELVRACAKALGAEVPAFRRERVRDLVLVRAGVDLEQISLAEACERLGIRVDESDTQSDLFYRLFLEKVEPNLGADPVFVYDYPKCQAALARLSDDGRWGERFELYWNGLELCNGFTELTDAGEQRKRLEEEARERQEAGKTVFPIDEQLLDALPRMKNPTFGNALGVDRLHMAILGTHRIADVLPMPVSRRDR